MADETTLVHVTHEATGKIGGIGAVLHGFFTSGSYLKAVERSIIVGPLFSIEGSACDRLGQDGEVLYSAVDGITKTDYRHVFSEIEDLYNVNIIYGRRRFIDKDTAIKSSPEVLLIDIRNADDRIINEFKKQLFEKFGIQSQLYEHIWEYEQYIRLAPPAIAALKAIGAAGNSAMIISHEFMGMPTVLAAMLDTSGDFKTAFYAHEVATMRRITEKHPGHDTMFYNALKQGSENRLCVSDVFGDQNFFFKHALIETSRYCDAVCAVGDYVADELRFLSPEFKTANIDIVYNGLPAYPITVAEKLHSKEKLQQYCRNLLGFEPDFIFTHVTRLVQSKGLWRDLQILENIEKEFRGRNKTAVMLLLSTEVAQRTSADIQNMEAGYNWPVAHREAMPDLSGGEADFYAKIQEFNAKNRNIKVIFLNQFGFDRDTCGLRMPADMEFMDVRKGSDVEFGLSIYEPFGISQLEPLTFGGICVISSVCGCAGFVKDVSNGRAAKNVIVADYTHLSDCCPADIENPLNIDAVMRRQIEQIVAKNIAQNICSALPGSKSEIKKMIKNGYELAKNMSWDAVVQNRLLKILQRVSSTCPANKS